MATYKSLKVLFHETKTSAESVVSAELERRLTNPATVRYPYYVGDNALFVVLNRENYELSETVWRTENTIQRLWNRLPRVARAHYYYTLLVEEIQSTNEIENVQSTRHEVAEALTAIVQERLSEPPKRFQEMASTFQLLIGDGEHENVEFPRSLSDVRALYDKLLGAEIADEDELDGDLFRRGEVHVSDGSRSIHRGVQGEEEIKSRLGVMLSTSGGGNAPMLVNALVSHFMVEHTHPFYDGNGRFGRFLLALSLSEILSAPTALSLSAEVMRQKQKYYKAFLKVEDPMNKGEATTFVTDMLGILCSAQMQLEASLRQRLGSLTRLSERIEEIQSEKALTPYQLQALYMLGQVLLFGPRSGATLDEISKFLGKSKNTVRPELGSLTERGFIKEVAKRPLVFALTEEGKEFLQVEEHDSL